MNDDLAFIETEVLVAELKRRFDTFILCGYKHVDQNNELLGRWFAGHPLQSIALCEYLKKGLLDGYEEISRPTRGDLREW